MTGERGGNAWVGPDVPQPTRWPALPVSRWSEIRDTLQLWLQMVGKVSLKNTPMANHWWNAALTVTARGFTTSLMHHPRGESFQIGLDLREHRLHITTASGAERSMPLTSGPVRQFFAELMGRLDELDLHTDVWPMPVEIEGAIPFDRDEVHTVYAPGQAQLFWRALVTMVPVFGEFRSRFVGKASPVHLFWGGLDLATTRFSGRTAPPHPGGAPHCGPQVMREAYSHEVSSAGYWPGGDGEGFFYSYAYPEPAAFAVAAVQPEAARWSADLAEFVLPYEAVRRAPDPAAALMRFLESTYKAAAEAAGWDRARLERPAAPAHAPQLRPPS
ncbi:hypothetical protein GB882_17910 [Georgenia ruanii]|uniref:Ava_C0101 and related proteins n=2 Tax=Georgenia ruanii TaxID=348442 RepID=A0A7J9V1J5_9MICO|nr:hypothetical protein [Georgenia ruanii]